MSWLAAAYAGRGEDTQYGRLDVQVKTSKRPYAHLFFQLARFRLRCARKSPKASCCGVCVRLPGDRYTPGRTCKPSAFAYASRSSTSARSYVESGWQSSPSAVTRVESQFNNT